MPDYPNIFNDILKQFVQGDKCPKCGGSGIVADPWIRPCDCIHGSRIANDEEKDD